MFHYLSLPDEPHEFERPAISTVRGRTADTEERDADLAAMMRGPEIGPSLYVSCCLDFDDHIHLNPAGYEAMPDLNSQSDLGSRHLIFCSSCSLAHSSVLACEVL
jgi:hypothetical protein